MHVLQGEEDPINDRLVGPVNDRLTLGHSPVDTDVFSSDETSLLRAEIEHHTGGIGRRPPLPAGCCAASGPLYTLKSVSASLAKWN